MIRQWDNEVNAPHKARSHEARYNYRFGNYKSSKFRVLYPRLDYHNQLAYDLLIGCQGGTRVLKPIEMVS